MTDETKETSEAVPPALTTESAVLGVSVRAWVTILMVVTVCMMSAWDLAVEEPLYSGFLMGLGFYLGQKTKAG